MSKKKHRDKRSKDSHIVATGRGGGGAAANAYRRDIAFEFTPDWIDAERLAR
jgi:hypothetical protein